MESFSLAVTFLLIVIVYEFLKPKSDSPSHDKTGGDDDA